MQRGELERIFQSPAGDAFPITTFGLRLPRGILAKWQSAGDQTHANLPLDTPTDADSVLVWWLHDALLNHHETDLLAAEQLVAQGPYAFGTGGDSETMPYGWLVRFYDAHTIISDGRFRAHIGFPLAMPRDSGNLHAWNDSVERMLLRNPVIGPALWRALEKSLLAETPRLAADALLAPRQLFALIADCRPDLRDRFDLTTPGGLDAFAAWFVVDGLTPYPVVAELFLTSLRLREPSDGEAFLGEGRLPDPARRCLDSVHGPKAEVADGRNIDAARAFRWWLTEAGRFGGTPDVPQQITAVVRGLRAFWFRANFGIDLRRAGPEIPPHLLRLHRSVPVLRASYDIDDPVQRAAFADWFERCGKDLHKDYHQIDVEFSFAPAVGVAQDIDIPLSEKAVFVGRAMFNFADPVSRENFRTWWTSEIIARRMFPRDPVLAAARDPGEAEDGLRRRARDLQDAPANRMRDDDVGGRLTWWRDSQRTRFRITASCPVGVVRTHSPVAGAACIPPGPAVAAGVEIVGYPTMESGQGEDSRLVYRALADLGTEPLRLFQSRRYPATAGLDRSLLPGPVESALGHPRVRIFCFSAFDMLSETRSEGLDGFTADHTIGYWPWELPFWPRQGDLPLDLVDEVWASTRFVFDAVAPTGKPVHHVPLPVTVDGIELPGRDAVPLPRDRFNFVFVFDGLSYFARKNPLAVLKAFWRAFPDDRDVGLVVKTMNAAHLPILSVFREIADSDPRVSVIAETWSRPKVLELLRSADAMVSLHRSEGFGRVVAEAMLLGTPVVVSDYSGTADFCSEDTAFLVSGRLVPVGRHQYLFWAGQQWFEASIDSAAEQMRAVRDQPGLAAARASAARATVADRYGLAACGRRYADLLRPWLA